MKKRWLLVLLVLLLLVLAPMCVFTVDRTEFVPTPATADPKGMTPAPGAMVVTTRHGTVLVPANFPRRESKDARMHACMMPGAGGQMQLICIFMPPSM